MNRRIRKKWRQHKPLTMSYSERRKQMRLFHVLVINMKHANVVKPYNLYMSQESSDMFRNWGIDKHGVPIIVDEPPLAGYFDGDQLDVCFLDKED